MFRDCAVLVSGLLNAPRSASVTRAAAAERSSAVSHEAVRHEAEVGMPVGRGPVHETRRDLEACKMRRTWPSNPTQRSTDFNASIQGMSLPLLASGRGPAQKANFELHKTNELQSAP